MRVINPATGDLVRDVPEDDATSVADKFAAARAAQPEWAARPLEERIEVIRRFRATVAYRIDDLAGILTSETGKPITQARNELNALLPRIDFFLDNVERTIDDEVVLLDDANGMEEVVSHEPLGVIANISAWNYPYFVGSNVWIPALLAGNAVLYKPSELAALTGGEVAEMFWGAGVPRDVFGLLIGGGDVGAALLDQRIDGVFFTGSYGTGKRIAEAVAGAMIPVQLELGGKDPVYVCDDVDVANAAEGLADGAFYNAGQSCCSVERIYVHERIYDEFVEHFVKTVDAFVVGDPTDDDTYIGPLTRPQQIEVLDAQVADAVAKGARVLAGGGSTGPWFLPTVLADVSHDMVVMRDESFGPIIGIQRVRDDGEATAFMNDTEFGLTAGVFSADEPRATEILREVNAGTAYWNCCDRVSPRLPWSGRHHSGIGSTLSTAGILAFTRPKAWHLRQS
jgi:acyl-CoA reductase-like NAD-dependent aldehyde dehydrogenase